ncbi:MCM2/3/5 family-domain-containing protein, partial [Dichomitus squalens]
GDIKIFLLGDLGTANSQLLKFVENVAAIAVHIPSKKFSAVGLTVSVQRSSCQQHDFYLEEGAMVFVDTGVDCVNELDMMRGEDRSAIHETTHGAAGPLTVFIPFPGSGH